MSRCRPDSIPLQEDLPPFLVFVVTAIVITAIDVVTMDIVVSVIVVLIVIWIMVVIRNPRLETIHRLP